VIRHGFAGGKLEKIPERERVGTPPFDAAFALDALEIPHEVHPKIPTGRNRRAALLGIERLAQLLGEGVEAKLAQNQLETVVRSVATGSGNLVPGQIHLPLLVPLTPKSHRLTPNC
jgi:hypothetical protein